MGQLGSSNAAVLTVSFVLRTFKLLLHFKFIQRSLINYDFSFV